MRSPPLFKKQEVSVVGVVCLAGERLDGFVEDDNITIVQTNIRR